METITEKKQRFVEIMTHSKEERVKMGFPTVESIKAELQITYPTYKDWKLKLIGDEDAYNSEDYMENNTEKVDKALMLACEKGNSAALKMYYQITKRIDEKTEVNVNIISADVIAKAFFKAEEELRNEGLIRVAGEGMAEVQTES